MIDTHAHLNFDGFIDDIDGVIARAAKAGVTQIINPASDYASIASAYDISAKHPGVFCMVGIHPDDISTSSSEQRESMYTYIRDRVVAVGEVGLDYFRLEDNTAEQVKKAQQQLFWQMIGLAKKAGLPLVIHTRDAFDDTLSILQESGAERVVIHCFSGTKEMASRALDLGFYLSFTGMVTYPKNDELREVATWSPLERMMVETDAPFLAPQPWRGKTCEPAYVMETARCIASCKGLSLDKFDEVTSSTAQVFFNLPQETLTIS